MEKPFAPSCERNREPILEVLRDHLADCRSVLEIGGGTGQHAIHFAAALPHVQWQTSEREQNLRGLRMWLDEAALPNVPAPLCLDVSAAWPQGRYDAVFSANTLHIMGWAEVERLFSALPAVCNPRAALIIYGPFNYAGRHTGEGNARFDAKLQAEAAHMGLRDVESVDALAQAAGFGLLEDRGMPADNRCLVWRRH